MTFDEFLDDFLERQRVGFTFGVEAGATPREQVSAILRMAWDARQPEVDYWHRAHRECRDDVLVDDPRNSQEPR